MERVNFKLFFYNNFIIYFIFYPESFEEIFVKTIIISDRI